MTKQNADDFAATMDQLHEKPDVTLSGHCASWINDALREADAALEKAAASKLRPLSQAAIEARTMVQSAWAALSERITAASKTKPKSQPDEASANGELIIEGANAPASSGGVSKRARSTLREQAECLHRELVMRHKVYPGRIKNGRMTEAEADREINLVRDARDTLRKFDEFADEMREALIKAISARKEREAHKDLESHPAVQNVRAAFPEAQMTVLKKSDEART